MRWPALVLLGACGGTTPPPVAGEVRLVLDIPNGALDPLGFSTVGVVVHTPTGDLVRSASIADLTFDLGPIDPSASVSVEATLRNDSGAAVGYGRTTTAVAIAADAEIVIPVRRPIAYLAGAVSRQESRGLHWTLAPATYSDLSIGTNLDGRTQVGSQAVLMIAAGPNLYLVTQSTSDPDGALTGPARVVPISTADHALDPALSGLMTGQVVDGAGADDGSTLVIGTTEQLFAVDTASGDARPLAAGNFARVAILTTADGEIDAVAIRNRGATGGTCSTAAELWWARLSGEPTARMIATGGFSDVATDRGRAYYIDACKGELGELTSDSIRPLRTISSAGAATALAVSNGQAYLGVESLPVTTSLLVAAIASNSEPRTLWTEAAQQVVRATDLRGVQRQLDATSAVIGHLEIGAGGDYVALTTRGSFNGAPVLEANFPEIDVDTEELRVFDAGTGGVVQRYRSWCAGFVSNIDFDDIERWSCASTTGQTAAAPTYGHHIRSMTFMFGKR
jgi:hypothetical protein